MTGPRANKFLLKVQEAAAGHPWYTRAPSVVNILLLSVSVSVCFLFSTRVPASSDEGL